jgi:hypothetical protein
VAAGRGRRRERARASRVDGDDAADRRAAEAGPRRRTLPGTSKQRAILNFTPGPRGELHP